MFSILLAIIYVAFVSLGLPDALLGSAWPVMHGEIGVPLSYAGIITMIIAGGTIISSLMSDRLTRRLGTGRVTAISVAMTAAALFGFSASPSFAALCLWAVPYGLGAGAVDAALNNYVALNYSSRHMNWLHCFWGVGAAVSPYIMGFCLSGGRGWSGGYFSVFVVQAVLTAILFISLPLWRKGKQTETVVSTEKPLGLRQTVKIRGVMLVLVMFFAYCALESTTGLWASSYLVEFRKVDAQTAAAFASLFYIGITAGRLLCGFVSERLGDKRLIRLGLAGMAAGIALIALPLSGTNAALVGLVAAGFGCAPVYPAIIHSTPANFGEENSQSVIGIEMAGAYAGSTFMPPLFGIIAQEAIGLFPLYMALLAATVLFMSERLNAVLRAKMRAQG